MSMYYHCPCYSTQTENESKLRNIGRKKFNIDPAKVIFIFYIFVALYTFHVLCQLLIAQLMFLAKNV